MSYFVFENKKIYYTEAGSGKPLLILHGNTASSKMFADIVQQYSEHFRVILLDFLGHGQSDRLEEFPADLWYYQATQVIAFLQERQYGKVNIIGSSGGALVAINVALEAPELVNKVIADSFEGERPLTSFVANAREDRESSKLDAAAKEFYIAMHGTDWEQVVDNDTNAIIKHAEEIRVFFHRHLNALRPELLLTGSKADEFVASVYPNYFERVYGDLIDKIGHGQIYLFDSGGHPAMLSNSKEFCNLSVQFFK